MQGYFVNIVSNGAITKQDIIKMLHSLANKIQDTPLDGPDGIEWEGSHFLTVVKPEN